MYDIKLCNELKILMITLQFCHWNNGKRRRKPSKKEKGKAPELESSDNSDTENESDCESTNSIKVIPSHKIYSATKINTSNCRRISYDDDSESEKEYYFKGRYVKTINDNDYNYDSDINDTFMCDSSEEFNENDIVVNDSDSDSDSDSDDVSNCTSENNNSNSNINSNSNSCELETQNKCNKESSCNKIYSCRIMKKIINKDENLVTVPNPYLKYSEVFNEKNCNILPPHREYDCEIKLKDNSSLFYGPLYSLNEVEREELKKYLKKNLEKAFIRKFTSLAGEPILFVKKKDGTLRLCVDCRKLNNITIRNSYPLPLISEFLDRVKDAKIFTKLDLKSA